MTKDKFILELPELVYSRQELEDIFNQCKQFGRLKGLKWREKPRTLIELDQATCLVIQYGDNMMLDESKNNLSYNFMQHDCIRNVVKRLNFNHAISPSNIDMLWYRPGFEFEPHVDHYAAATMMWPIIPESGGAPIDFYHNDKVTFTPGEPAAFKDIITTDDLIYTHYYNTTYPTIFNSHQIHGVRTVDHVRVYLRLRINEAFDSIVQKYNSGTLIK
jgi:hypothetical protein